MVKHPLKGMSTLEILIAFAVITLTLSAIIMVIFGNRSFTVDSQVSNEALEKAQAALEYERAVSRSDFLAASSTSGSETVGSISYTKTMTVTDLTPCQKIATSTITWNASPLRPQTISISTFLTDTASALALAGHCIGNPPTGVWQTVASVSGGDGSVNGTGIYASKGYVYLTANSTSANKDDLLIYSVDASHNITAHGHIDMSSVSGMSTSIGLSSVVVVGNYAYAMNTQKDHQLVVVNVSNPDNISVTNSFTLHNITSGFTCNSATNCLPGGRSITYYNGYLYIGTGYLAFGATGENQEFQIWCINDPSVPLCSASNPVWVGGVNVDRNVNAIAIQGHYAYLATSNDNGELTVIDLNNLSATPVEIDAAGAEDAYDLYVIGTKLYLGRAQGTATEPDFLVYSIQTPGSPTLLGSKNYSEDINGVIVFNNTAFLATTNNFEILNVSNPASITSYASLSFPKTATGIDYDSSYIYVPFIKQGSTLMNVYYPG